MDEELRRINEEIKRHDEKRKLLVERKNRRLRAIRAKQLKDKEAWTKKTLLLLDKALTNKYGDLYWYDFTAEGLCQLIMESRESIASMKTIKTVSQEENDNESKS